MITSAAQIALVDIHCHIVYCVDDGSDSMEISLAMLHQEYKAGVRVIVCTPHYRIGMFETSRERCRRHFEYLKKESENLYPDLELYLGCEFHSNPEILKTLDQDPAYRIAGGDTVLIEFSSYAEKSDMRRTLNILLQSGYRPIIAHAERYEACHDRDFLRELRKMGASIQINADSLLGMDGWGTRFFTRKLLKEGLVDIVASDAHNTTDRATHLGQCAEYIEKKYGISAVRRLFRDNPLRALEARGE